MEDNEIIALFLSRNEKAIAESSEKYGTYCSTIAMNILHNAEDAEECVDDTWCAAWNHIPPDKPNPLKVYFGHIVRRLAINRWHFVHAAKRDRDMVVALDELEYCIAAPDELPDDQETQLKEDINNFLSSLKQRDRVIFVLRYYHAQALKDIAEETDMNVKNVSKRLLSTREKLRLYLNERGYRL